MSYANNEGADQPVHPRSLISAFVLSCLDSIISLDSIAEISRLASRPVCVWPGRKLPKTRFLVARLICISTFSMPCLFFLSRARSLSPIILKRRSVSIPEAASYLLRCLGD